MILTKKLAEHGVILGLIGISVNVLLYFMGPEYMVKLWVGLINLLLTIGLLIFFGIMYRRSIGGYMNYWNAYVASVIMMCISGVLGVIYGIVLFHVIDPELPMKMHDAIMQSTVNWMQDFKVPQEKIDQIIDQMQKQGSNEFTIGRQLLGFVWIAVASGIFSFLIAAFTKKRKPIIDENPIDQVPS